MSEKIDHKHIDADELYRWIKTECNPYGKPTLEYETSVAIMEHIGKMPAADMELGIKENEAAFISTVYGYDAQSRQCIEEMSELTQAINKFWRKQLKCGKVDFENAGFDNKERDNLIEEMADVQIMLWQMKHLLCCEELFEKEIREKLDRQIERIKAEDENKQR